MGRIVCFGELLLRLTAPGRELLQQATNLGVHVGGAEANVAIGLASLGHSTAVVSRVPENPLGHSAIAHLRRFGVSTDAVECAPGRMGLYFLSVGAGLRPSTIVYDREASSFALAGSEDFDFERALDGAELLHLSGITPALGRRSAEAAIAAAEAARARGIKVSFDGNYRAQLWARWDGEPTTILRELVSLANIMFGNHRDIALLLGQSFSGDGEQRRREAAQAAFDAYPGLELIASTARHVDDADRHRISARVDVRQSGMQTEEVVVAGIIDRIGTGDAFASGVLHALLSGGGPEKCARFGLALACLKHSVPGDASLLTQADIDVFLDGELDVRR